ncbi:MAG TPA: RluA family pseudouridine synthase [Pseudolabrys sp.]|nr:RluA family pseudouridine synthase [Pseudolabrys sp.]
MTLDNTLSVAISADEAGGRLDRVLAARLGEGPAALSRSRLKALIEAGDVTIDGRTIRDPSHRVNSGQSVAVRVPPPEMAAPQAEDIPLSVVFEDDQLIVIDKPKGLVVHPAVGHQTGTLVNALIAHCGDSLSGIGGVKRPGIVHRLDKDTTGLMVVAKTDRAHRALAKQFADKSDGRARRAYLALVWGVPDRPRGTIDAPLGRHAQARERQAVRRDGRHAVTQWHLVERFVDTSNRPLAALLECRLETGRTHQIRVHLAHAGHPIMGDETYATGFKTKTARLTPGPAEALQALGRQALHAYLLGFEHPTSHVALEFRSELPADFARLRRELASPA